MRESIERFEAEQRVLAAQIAYADVHVDLRGPSVAYWDVPGQSIVRAAR